MTWFGKLNSRTFSMWVGFGLNSFTSKILLELRFGEKEVIARLLPEISYKWPVITIWFMMWEPGKFR